MTNVDEADGVSLRPLELEDIVRVREWRNLPEVRQSMYTDHEISVQEHARWFGAALSDEARRFWIIQLHGEPVGLTSLYDISTTHATASWAIYIGEASARGRGVASGALRLAIDAAFLDHGLHKVCCEALATNGPALRLYERHGFRREGLFAAHVLKAGERIDVVALALFRDDWAARRQATPT